VTEGGGLPGAVRARALDVAANVVAARGQGARPEAFRRQSREAHEAVLQVARQQGTRQEIATVLASLVDTCFWLEDLEATWRYGLEARQLMEALGDSVALVRVLEILAGIPLRRRDLPAARKLLEERLAICRRLGNPALLVHSLGGMGHIERDEGNYGRARAYYQESTVLRQRLGDKFALAQSLEDLALLAGRQHQTERAIRLLGAQEAFCETLDSVPALCDAAGDLATIAEGRATLGEARFAALWAEGRALSLEEAVTYALEDPDASLPPCLG